ncbi:MAG: glycosyltransferase family 4 protein [Planctomycetota bacterium]|nr:glycosyltransferase family 4 protein [Planctomycetota bacterium]
MRIAHVLPAMRRAGAETVVALLSRGLAAAGHEVHVIVAGGRFDYGRDLERTGVAVHLLGLFQRYPRYWELGVLRRIRAAVGDALRGIAADVAHCHLAQALIWAAPAIRELGIPAVYTFHEIGGFGGGFSPFGRLWDRRFEAAIRESGARLLAVSHHAAEEWAACLGIEAEAITPQPNPVDLSMWPAPVAGPPPRRIVMVGTLYALKRQNVALRAICRLPGASLDLIGDGPMRPDLERLAAKLGVRDRVRFLGVRDDVPELMRGAGAAWMLSEQEGMGLAAVEAMASGVPIVATDVPALNELVRDGYNGLLVPLDDPEATAATTERIFSDDALRGRLIGGGLETARRFALEEVVRSHIGIYEETIGRKRSRQHVDAG